MFFKQLNFSCIQNSASINKTSLLIAKKGVFGMSIAFFAA
jgi:hypothetical protein